VILVVLFIYVYVCMYVCVCVCVCVCAFCLTVAVAVGNWTIFSRLRNEKNTPQPKTGRTGQGQHSLQSLFPRLSVPVYSAGSLRLANVLDGNHTPL
jgi:hypothetical protein